MKLLNNEEVQAFEKFRRLIEEFLLKNDESDLVKQFIREADEKFIFQFLRGRKLRPKYAFETLVRHAEIKLIKYPDMFEDKSSPNISSLLLNPPNYVLKHRDRVGRRISVFNFARWNPDTHSMLDLIKLGIYFGQKSLSDEDTIKNGTISVLECSTFGLKQSRHFNMKHVRLGIDIFWHSFPIRQKALYIVNSPSLLTYLVNLIKVFVPPKMKERLHVSSKDQGFKELHKILSPEILPEFLGGTLTDEEAMDKYYL